MKATPIYIILHPHSLTNPSDRYRVVDWRAWVAYINEATRGMAIAGETVTYEIAGETVTYEEAKKIRDRLNGQIPKDINPFAPSHRERLKEQKPKAEKVRKVQDIG